eukprot:NODE_3592_length_2013_cov_8.662778.p1 GENE.NODE_3592_length_2013_cov_8.662778~~NODE_3592_length_2013_cov_8.662778.p1  ORF type:complete len:642 (+),score=156.47 NODE_3592_length_2013_cov_8.662778:133-1926(+)
MANMEPAKITLQQRLADFNQLSKELNISKPLRYRGREYLVEYAFHEGYVRDQEIANSFGHDLRAKICRHMSMHFMKEIWLFQGRNQTFVADLSMKVTAHFYEGREVVEPHGQLAVVERGSIGRLGRILVPFQCWGEDMILPIPSLRYNPSAVTLSHTQVVMISREDLGAVLLAHPADLCHFRRLAAKISLVRVSNLYAKEKASQVFDPENQWVHDLFEKTKTRITLPSDAAPPLGTMQFTLEEKLENIQIILTQASQLIDPAQLAFTLKHRKAHIELMQGQVDRFEETLLRAARQKAAGKAVDVPRIRAAQGPNRKLALPMQWTFAPVEPEDPRRLSERGANFGSSVPIVASTESPVGSRRHLVEQRESQSQRAARLKLGLPKADRSASPPDLPSQAPWPHSGRSNGASSRAASHSGPSGSVVSSPALKTVPTTAPTSSSSHHTSRLGALPDQGDAEAGGASTVTDAATAHSGTARQPGLRPSLDNDFADVVDGIRVSCLQRGNSQEGDADYDDGPGQLAMLITNGAGGAAVPSAWRRRASLSSVDDMYIARQVAEAATASADVPEMRIWQRNMLAMQRPRRPTDSVKANGVMHVVF